MQDFFDVFERLFRFMKHLPSDGGQDLIVLKGHLLIEEVISDIISFHLSMSNPLDIGINNSLMFNQKLNLCWALIGGKFDNEFWRSVKQLNTIRNAMAHSIEPKYIDAKIKAFTESVIRHSNFNNEQYLGRDLEFSISWLFIGLNSHLHGLKNS